MQINDWLYLFTIDSVTHYFPPKINITITWNIVTFNLLIRGQVTVEMTSEQPPYIEAICVCFSTALGLLKHGVSSHMKIKGKKKMTITELQFFVILSIRLL